jgi:hypothetical protein
LLSIVSVGFAACEGNLDCDADTDGADLALFAADFGATGCSNCDNVIARMDALEKRIADLEKLLANVSQAEDTTYPTIRFKGVNVQIINDSGHTNINNGTGNLIVGYDEERSSGSDKNGSHNIVVGIEHNYTSFGGLVAGKKNSISHEWASVTGGYDNSALGSHASVSGGAHNIASSNFSSISGGSGNQTNGWVSSISGGQDNFTEGDYSSVSGGQGNKARGYASSVLGGGGHDDFFDLGNIADADFSSVSGGKQNTASVNHSSVLGDTGGVYVDITNVH